MRRPAKSNWSYILFLALLAVVVGGLAFGLQYLRGSKDPPPPDPGPGTGAVLVCRFLGEPGGGNYRAVWDKEDKAYVKEIEPGQAGYYDFLFENPSDKAGELGLVGVSCTCSSVLVGFAETPAWDALAKKREEKPAENIPEEAVSSWVRVVKDEEALKTAKGPASLTIAVPPRAKAVLRIEWDGRGKVGEKALHATVWHKAAGSERGGFANLNVTLVFRPPVMFYPDKAFLGFIRSKDQASTKFFLWSATRSDAKVRIQEEKPLLAVRTEALDASEIADLQKKLDGEKMHTRVRAAWRAWVTVHEQKEDGDKLVYHDLGPFFHVLNVQVDGEPVENLPEITGGILSDIDVGGREDQGKVNLGVFSAASGKTKTINLWTDTAAVLELVKHDPGFLRVRLLKQEQESDKRKWQLEVTVPHDALYGPFPDKSAVFLRVNSEPPRLIRVPVVGTATGR